MDGYRYGFNTQEKVEEIASGHYTAMYWEYDSRLGRRWNLDPKPTSGISHYAVLNNSPMLMTDYFGDKPTKKQAAAMSAHVYGDKTDDILKGGWKVSTRDFGIQKVNDDNGLRSQVYERTKKGKTEYVYATAGTEAEWADVSADLLQPVRLSKQYDQAVENAKGIDKQVGAGRELTFTGHSLGGGEAAAAAMATGRDAITFNAAGVGILSQWKYGNKHKSQIDAYILITDPLNTIQNGRTTLGIIMPDVNGTRHYQMPRDMPSIYNGHSMDNMLKVFDINPAMYAKPPVAPPPMPNDNNVITSPSDALREASRWMHW